MFTSGTPSARQSRLSICPRFDAAAVWTRARCPSRRIVSTMPSAVSGLIKAAAPSRAETPSGSGRHVGGWHHAILGVRAGRRTDRNGPAHQRGCTPARHDDRTRAFVAHRQRLAETPSNETQAILRDQGFDFGPRRGATDPQRGKVDGPEQQEDVGWIERSRVDPHHDFVVPGFGDRHLLQPELQSASLFHEGTHFETH